MQKHVILCVLIFLDIQSLEVYAHAISYDPTKPMYIQCTTYAKYGTKVNERSIYTQHCGKEILPLHKI